MTVLKVGLAGLGTVGLGTWNVCKNNAEEIVRKAGKKVKIIAVAEAEKNKFTNGCDVLITNGKIGFSSHHGIHGNNCTNLILDNLTIYDFEVCGIALNGSQNAILNNITIRDNLQKVPLNATYSQTRFLRKHLKNINNVKFNNKLAKKYIAERCEHIWLHIFH